MPTPTKALRGEMALVGLTWLEGAPGLTFYGTFASQTRFHDRAVLVGVFPSKRTVGHSTFDISIDGNTYHQTTHGTTDAIGPALNTALLMADITDWREGRAEKPPKFY